MMTGWMIYQDGKPLYDTLRRYRPQAWAAWERAVRPAHGFVYDVTAKRVKITAF